MNAYRRLGHHELRLLINFHTQGTAIRPEVLKKLPFRHVPMGEDILWAKEVMEAGYKIVHEPAAVVLHSHKYSVLEHFQRNFDDGRINRCVVGREMNENAIVPKILDLVRDDWEYLKNDCGLNSRCLKNGKSLRCCGVLLKWLVSGWVSIRSVGQPIRSRFFRSRNGSEPA